MVKVRTSLPKICVRTPCRVPICVYKNSLPQTIRKPQSIILLYSFLTSGLGSVYRKMHLVVFGACLAALQCVSGIPLEVLMMAGFE